MNLGEYTKLKEQLAVLEARVAALESLLEQKSPISSAPHVANRTLTLKHA